MLDLGGWLQGLTLVFEQNPVNLNFNALIQTKNDYGKPDRTVLMPACDRVSGPAQIFRQIHFHLRRCFIRHRVQVGVKFWQRADAVARHHCCGLDAGFVIRKPFFRGQARHTDINARKLRITIGIFGPDFPQLAHGRIEQDHVNIVMIRFPFDPKLFERPSLHRWFSRVILLIPESTFLISAINQSWGYSPDTPARSLAQRNAQTS